MNVLLIEGQELTRELLLHLLVQTFPHTRVTALATIDEIASGQMPYEAILLGMDSIQGIEKTLSWLIKPDATLIVQMSSRLNEPGAGVLSRVAGSGQQTTPSAKGAVVREPQRNKENKENFKIFNLMRDYGRHKAT